MREYILLALSVVGSTGLSRIVLVLCVGRRGIGESLVRALRALLCEYPLIELFARWCRGSEQGVPEWNSR